MMMWTNTWRLLIVLTLVTGCGYPFLITGLGQLCWPWQANGSMVFVNNQAVGSQWIGQEFHAEQYFWGRPSATAVAPYNGLASGGSNLGPSNPELFTQIRQRIRENHFIRLPIPVELVTASGSGLDPEISPKAAYYQVARIAQTRHLSVEQVQNLIQTHIHPRTLGILGEPRVNVLKLNLALDKINGVRLD